LLEERLARNALLVECNVDSSGGEPERKKGVIVDSEEVAIGVDNREVVLDN